MTNRWMNLVLIVVVVAAAVFVYQTYFKGEVVVPPVDTGKDADFEQGFKPVKELWLEKEIEVEPMTLESVEKIAKLSDAELGEMKDRLTNYRNEMKEKEGAAAGAVGIYIDLVDYVRFSKNVDRLNNELDNSDLAEPCNDVSALKERNNSLERKISAMEAFNEKISMFRFRHKDEAKIVGLVPFDDYIVAMNKSALEEVKGATASLERDCG